MPLPFTVEQLWEAWERVRENEGCAGADALELDRFAAELTARLDDLRGAVELPLPGGDLPQGPSASALETGPQAPTGALRRRSLAARFLSGERAPAVAPVPEFLMGLAEYSDKSIFQSKDDPER